MTPSMTCPTAAATAATTGTKRQADSAPFTHLPIKKRPWAKKEQETEEDEDQDIDVDSTADTVSVDLSAAETLSVDLSVTSGDSGEDSQGSQRGGGSAQSFATTSPQPYYDLYFKCLAQYWLNANALSNCSTPIQSPTFSWTPPPTSPTIGFFGNPPIQPSHIHNEILDLTRHHEKIPGTAAAASPGTSARSSPYRPRRRRRTCSSQGGSPLPAKYVCNWQECGKSFVQRSSLTTHMRVHTNERPFKCTERPMSFGDFSTYVKHKRVHTGEKPYACPMCPRTFSQSGNMHRHLKTVHRDAPPEVLQSQHQHFSSHV